nr:unnamed protein product [Callosobruchus chinensis]
MEIPVYSKILDTRLLICQCSSKIPDRVSGGVNMGKDVIIITCDIAGMAIVKMNDSSEYLSAFLIDYNWLCDNECVKNCIYQEELSDMSRAMVVTERVIDEDTKHYFDSYELHDDKLYKKVSKPLCVAP